jgi:4-hydroxy-tetrahydrodipicolinate reductase
MSSLKEPLDLSTAKLRVAVVGASGRLGAFAARLFESHPRFELVARWDRGDDWRQLAKHCGASVAFEATRAGQGFEHARALLEAGVRPVVATSGVDPAQVGELDALARKLGLGGVVVPNFSLGAWLMQRAAELAAPHFAQAEIVEAHHTRKADSPSGTAADTARRIAAARERAQAAPLAPHGRGQAARGELRDGVALHSLRLDGVYARQEVLFSGVGELLAIRHEMGGPEAFAPGIELATLFAARASGVHLGLDAVLDAPPL